MRRRDRQNEIIVALVVFIAMGFALVFSIVLSLEDQDEPSDEGTATEVANATQPGVQTAFAPSQVPSATPRPDVTDAPTEEMGEKATVTIRPVEYWTPTRRPGEEVPTETFTATPSDTPTPTPSPTGIPSDTPSPSDTPNPTRTPRPSNTPSDTPTETPRASNTPSDTPRPLIPTRVIAANTTNPPTRTTIPLVQRTNAPAVAVAASPTMIPCTPRSDWDIYAVDIGDTFFSIARRYDLTVDQLAQANCIADPSRILAGQPIRVPNGEVVTIEDAAIENCNTADALLTAPMPGDNLDGFVTLRGVARGQNFRRYILDWRADAPSVDFRSFAEEFNAMSDVGDLGRFNTDAFPLGLYWLRLRVLDTNDFIIGECSIRVRFR